MSKGQNVEWDKMPNRHNAESKKGRRDIMSNGTKRRIEIMSKVRKANWDKMSTGKKNVESKQCRIRRQNVEKG